MTKTSPHDPAATATDTPDVSAAGNVAAHTPHGPFPYRTVALGTVGSVLLMLGSLGAGGILISDPVIGAGPLSWIRYGHGQILANIVVYTGFAMLVWAWIRLGRFTLSGKVGSKPILVAAGCWMAPLLIAPPLFTRDVFAYLAQGALLYDHDPYANAPNMVDGLPTIVQNVYPLWQTTPSPYGPLFLAMSKGIVTVTGDDAISGVIVTRLVLLVGLVGLLWALPRLVRHLGGNLPVTLWLVVAGPMMVVHLVGGPHNDLIMLGFLAVGVLAALERKHALAIVLVTLGMLTKPTAALALPFIVWIWANHLPTARGKVRNFFSSVVPALAIFGVVFVGGTAASLGSFNIGWFAGLEGPQMIQNYMNIPTGIGQLLYVITMPFLDATSSPFIAVMRGTAFVVLGGFAIWQWWLARDGGTKAVMHMGITLLAAAILAPPTLPWYLSWGFVILAAFAWPRRHLAVVVGVSVFLVLAYYPTGEQALYTWWFILPVFALSWYSAKCLLKPDPLGVVAALRSPSRELDAQAEPVGTTPSSRSTG